MIQSANPLRQFFRQPAIYMRLPSEGEHWPPDVLIMPENQELPVYPMTAIDEITYRTPDALFNGEAVTNVIKSCMPNIKDPWQMPTVDLNAILVAIRIASYGHDMELVTECPKCQAAGEYTLDLRTVLDQLKSSDYHQPIEHGDLVINFRPLSYKAQNSNNQTQFEQQKNIQTIQDSDVADTEKIAKLNQALARITDLTIDALKWSIASIRTPHEVVTDSEFIQEFLRNCDRKLFIKIREHIVALRADSELKPLHIKCGSCDHEYDQTLSLDQTSFFEGAS
jgi:hypothetical protein